MSSTDIITTYQNFNPEKLTFTELKETKSTKSTKSKGTLIGYSRYLDENNKENKLLLQSPRMVLNYYGIPSKDSEFHKTDEERTFIKIPLDLTDPNVAIFANKIIKFDSIMSSDEYKLLVLGKKYYKHYKYVPVYRESQVQHTDNDDEEDNVKNKKNKSKEEKVIERPPYMKLKLDLEWPENTIKTSIYEVSTVNNKKIRTKITDINSIDDFAKYICYMCNYRCIITPSKMWGHAKTKPNPDYGVSFKIISIEVEQSKYFGLNNKQIYESDNFIDSDNEDEIEKLSVAKTTKSNENEIAKVSVEKTTKSNDKLKNNTNLEDSDDDSNDNTFKPTTKLSVTKTTKSNENEIGKVSVAKTTKSNDKLKNNTNLEDSDDDDPNDNITFKPTAKLNVTKSKVNEKLKNNFKDSDEDSNDNIKFKPSTNSDDSDDSDKIAVIEGDSDSEPEPEPEPKPKPVQKKKK